MGQKSWLTADVRCNANSKYIYVLLRKIQFNEYIKEMAIITICLLLF